MNPLAPTRSRSHLGSPGWTADEDEQLIKLMNEAKWLSWKDLVPFFPGKSAAQVCRRWEKVLNPHLVKGSWTREEDLKIMDFVQKHGPRNWVKLATALPGRIGKQCRERWTNHLDPNIVKGPWSRDEDAMLLDLHARFGNQWTKIATFYDGRTDNCVKNRWNSSLKKKLERAGDNDLLISHNIRGRKQAQAPKTIDLGLARSASVTADTVKLNPLAPPPGESVCMKMKSMVAKNEPARQHSLVNALDVRFLLNHL
jgi:hypothetical protein